MPVNTLKKDNIIEFDLSKRKTFKDFYSFNKSDNDNLIEIPYFLTSVRAGIPAQVGDNTFVEKTILVDSNKVRNPSHTFAVNVAGDSMEPFLFDGDIILVDKSQSNKALNKICVCWYDGGYTVKILKIKNNTMELVSLNPKYPPIKVNKLLDDFHVAGIVIDMMRSKIDEWSF